MNFKKIVVLLLFLVAIAGIIAPVNAITSENKVSTFESKEKTVNYKITWNGNGGKIGTKNTVTTSVKKGSKIGKLATAPKRSGYTFNGWYTKKTGGKKISKNSKPTKSLTYFAQWTKSTSAPKILGHWQYYNFNRGTFDYYFYADGSFQYFRSYIATTKFDGKYSVSNGKVIFKDRKFYDSSFNELNQNQLKFGLDDLPKYQYSAKPVQFVTLTSEFKLSSDGAYLEIVTQDRNGGYYGMSSTDKFEKVS